MPWLNFFKRFRPSKGAYMAIPFSIVFVFLILIPAIFILVFAFTPLDSEGGVSGNFSVLNSFVWYKIFKSFWMAIVTVILCILIAYPLCYSLSVVKNAVFRSVMILLLSAPMWCSLLVKLIGIKSFFDIINGYSNSTYGDVYSIIGMVYMYIPFMLIALYSCLVIMPKSLVLASQDLGYNAVKTFFHIVVPFTKTALLSGSALVFLPCFTTVAIPQFLNNNNNNDLIGDIIFDIGGAGVSNRADLIIASTISLVVVIVAFVFLFFIRFIPFFVMMIRTKQLQKWVHTLIKKCNNLLLNKRKQ